MTQCSTCGADIPDPRDERKCRKCGVTLCEECFAEEDELCWRCQGVFIVAKPRQEVER